MYVCVLVMVAWLLGGGALPEVVWWHTQEVEERLKQKVQPLSADLSLPAGLEKRMKTGQKAGGYGGSKEAAGYTKVCTDLA